MSAALDSEIGPLAEAKEATDAKAVSIEVPLLVVPLRAPTIRESYTWDPGELQSSGAALHRSKEALSAAEKDLALLQSEDAKLDEELAS
ncbi:hypothetical protein Nepgr_020726 [Nepenthes gracilis]|uniref:Uncharacterized protein n=1 Tax=Nepenthes gracilis TaxID=150966 RepID=A0AAD3XWJ0_NEPGR|nr:hypothetical protein Nepgr_020726 [Nepenthes gracilis]